MTDELLSTEQVAAMLNVMPLTVRRWVKRKGLPDHKLVNRVIRYSKDEVLEWVKAQGGRQHGD